MFYSKVGKKTFRHCLRNFAKGILVLRLFRQVWTFFKRDWQLGLTCYFSFVTTVLGVLAFLVSFFFIGKLVSGNPTNPYLA